MKENSLFIICWIARDEWHGFYLYGPSAPTRSDIRKEWIGDAFCSLFLDEVPEEFRSMTWEDEPQKIVIEVLPGHIKKATF